MVIKGDPRSLDYGSCLYLGGSVGRHSVPRLVEHAHLYLGFTSIRQPREDVTHCCKKS